VWSAIKRNMNMERDKKCVNCGGKGERYVYTAGYENSEHKWGYLCLKCGPYNVIGKEWLWSQKEAKH